MSQTRNAFVLRCAPHVLAIVASSACGRSVAIDDPFGATDSAGAGASASTGPGSSAGGSAAGTASGGDGGSGAATTSGSMSSSGQGGGAASGAGGSAGSGGGAGGSSCVPTPELCNLLDDDCDGVVDDGNPQGGADCFAMAPGVCGAGVIECKNGSLQCMQKIFPSPEVCDDLDNDCDGETDENDVPGGPSVCQRRVFVTSEIYTGNLGGLAGADAKCQTLANAAGLGGTFKAWLSDSSASAADRLTHIGKPYVLVDGTVVAADWSVIVSGGPFEHAINMTELGTPAPVTNHPAGSDQIFTGTNSQGQLFWPDACNNWTSTQGQAAMGSYDAAGNGSWTFEGVGRGVSCSVPAPIYCFEQ